MSIDPSEDDDFDDSDGPCIDCGAYCGDGDCPIDAPPKENQHLLQRIAELEHENEKLREFYFLMRRTHGHLLVDDALKCCICKGMEETKDELEHMPEEK